ncbi:hypothetical protein P0F65_11390 [Sphingomonas sp. I4]
MRHPDRLDEMTQARLLDRLRPGRFIAIADDARAIAPALARRIATVEIAAPPLTARRRDVPLLARHFARLAAQRHGRPCPASHPPPRRCSPMRSGPTRYAGWPPRSNARCCWARTA